MAVVVGALILALVFVIAAVVIGREAHRLDAQPPRAVFNLEEAVEFVARQLPFEVSAEISYDEVRSLLRWHLEFLRRQGATGNGDGSQSPAPILVGGVEAVDHLLNRAEATGMALESRHAHAVVDAQLAYLETIGVVGPVAEAPDGEDAEDD
ncbi:MAG TPA: hypothetical protein VGA13_07895 [Acidimicrobiales bacterium]